MEIELFVPDDENVIITRRWNQDNKSSWSVGGRKVGPKEVEKLVAHFRIQVDNLCQFLPQDKVHDFSRQNSKGLLDSTVDAVGDQELKKRHLELKELQKNLLQGEDLFERKRQMLQEKREQGQRLEEEVKAFEEKNAIERKIQLLEGRLAWSKVKEVQRETKGKKDVKEDKEKKLAREEAKMNPLKISLKEAEKKKQTLKVKIEAEVLKGKEGRGKAMTHSKNIEKFEEQIKGLDEELEEIARREEDKLENIQGKKNLIAELEAEFHSMEEGEVVGPQQIDQARREVHQRQRAVEDLQGERENIIHNVKGLQASKGRLQHDLAELNNVDKQKLQVLKNKNDDAHRACLWLRDHLDQFRGEVHEPFIMCGNVTDPANAMYVENTVNHRDLTAFFFSDAEDMNNFLRITRQEKGWKKVSAVQADQVSTAYVPEVPGSSLEQYGFVSYVREMVTGPDNVVAFLCHNYNIHKVAVFQPQAERHNDLFVDSFKMTKFYLGNKCQTVSGSRYSQSKTTMTRSVTPHNVLQVSLDSERAGGLQQELAAREQEEAKLVAMMKSMEEDLKRLHKDLEEARKSNKDLERRKNFKTSAGARIEVEKRNLRQLLAEGSSDQERAVKRAGVKPSVKQMIKSVQLLQHAIGEVERGQTAVELLRLAARPMEELVEERKAALATAMESLKGLKAEVTVASQELDEAKQVLRVALSEAKAATGSHGNEPATELVAKWEKERLPSGREEIEVLAQELQGEANSMEEVDPRKVADYRNIKEVIQELERDIQRREQQQRDSEQQMDQVNIWS